MNSIVQGLCRNAARSPSAPAVRGGRYAENYRQLLERSSRLAGRLDAHGCRKLALLAPNSPDWIVVDIAALLAGVTLVPIPAFFSTRQRRHVATSSGTDWLIASEPLDDVDCIAMERVSDALWMFRIDARPGVREPGTAKISYTSGTSGEPKGVCLAGEALEAVASSLHAVTRALDIRRHLCLLPLSTLLENVAGVYAPLLAGAEIAVPDHAESGLIGGAGLDVARLLHCIDQYRPHSVILVPQMLVAIVEAIENGARIPESLRFVAVGGAHVSSTLLERADILGLPVYEGYGLTECASVVAMNAPGARRRGSVGRPLPHARVRVDETSEIVVGGAVMRGYVGEPALDSDEIRTGDIGAIDEEGFVYVRGRRRNVFITSYGRNVSPEWVEAELARSLRIRQAALFGEARPWNVAVIVPAPGARLDEVQEDIERLNTELPDYARVGDWVLADEPFTPRNGLATANGKLHRSALHRLYQERIDSRYDNLVAESPGRMA